MGRPLAYHRAPLASFRLPAGDPGAKVSLVHRIRSIDVVRGAVMVLMAIDHVRVYSGLPAGGPTAGIFFTRWVTHFCAPAFAFLAGTSAFLYGQRLGDPAALARHLVKRGLLLVVLELTVIRASWTFNVHYSEFVLAGVIWMLGWCMVLLAGLVRLRTRSIGLIGICLMLFQQVFRLLPGLLPPPVQGVVAPVWNVFYPSGAPGWSHITILYVIVPWLGVMAAGYAFGAIMLREPDARRRLCLRIGLSATALFVVFAAVFTVLAPAGDDSGPALFRALNPPKYPVSQPFLLMTLGPMIALLPVAERARGWFADALATFGRVPFFYYLLHIPLIHVTALAAWYLRDGGVHMDWFATAPYVELPPEHQWGLPLLYLVFAVDVAILYVACRWYDGHRQGRREGSSI
jgi:uncharacterized membrane protein